MNQKRGNATIFLGSKRGQVTVFIIVGIILVFAFAGILFITKNVAQDDLEQAQAQTTTATPQQFNPITSFTESCVAQTAQRGLTVLGQQGGYVHPETVATFSQTNPTQADGVSLAPQQVPYWYYNKASNEDPVAQIVSLRPELESNDPLSIATQLENFVEEELATCLQEYDSFTAQGFSIEKTEPTVQVTFTDNDVIVILEMEVEANKDKDSFTATQFVTRLPVKFKNLYGFATKITGVQQNISFLERQALEIITSFSAVDTQKLPPMQALRFDPVPTAQWSEQEIKLKVKGLLQSYVPVLRSLDDPQFYRYTYQQDTPAVVDYTALYQKNYDNMIVPFDSGKGIEVNFDYFGWEPYLDMNDKGGSIKPREARVNYDLLHFATQHYYTTYDLSYPVLVTLRDPDAFNGEGYSFVFALEANVRNNQVFRDGDVLPAPVTDPLSSQVCDDDKRITEPITALVIDSQTRDPLEKVSIGLSVPFQDNCQLGETNAHGKHSSAYPPVYGGVATFSKPEYLTNFYPIDTYTNKDKANIIGYAVAGQTTPVIPLHPYKTINVSFRKKTLEKCVDATCPTQGPFGSNKAALYSYIPTGRSENHSWVFNSVAQSLDPKERGMLIMERVADSTYGQFQEDVGAVATITSNQLSSIRLVPGTYRLNALLIYDDELIIPTQTRCTGPVCFDLNQTLLAQHMSGQLFWQEKEQYLTITPEELYGSNHITFTLLGANLVGVPEENRVLEDMQIMSELTNLSANLHQQLPVEFS